MTETTCKTLARRIAEGRLPVSEALRYAMQVGDALRKLHDAGEVHGAVTPHQILLTDRGAELSSELPAGNPVTPYTAPEVLLGRPADARSDIFSFGAVLFEALTGRRAFEGEDPATIAANLAGAATPSSGSPAADRILGPCLAKNPDQRAARMQKILMELKLLSGAARRAEAQAAAPSHKESEIAALRAEVQAMESRIAGQFVATESRVAEAQRTELLATESRIAGQLTASESRLAETHRIELQAIESRTAGQFAATESRVAEAQRTELLATESRIAGQLTAGESRLAETHRTELQAIESRIAGQFAASESRVAEAQRTELGQAEARLTRRLVAHDEEIAAIQASVLEAVGSIREKLLSVSSEVAAAQEGLGSRPTNQEINDRILFLVDRGFDAVSQQIGRLEHGLDELRNQHTQFERSVSADLSSVDQNFTAHSTAIDAARTAMAQTDDLVERVVEALESLQSAVLDQNDAPGGKSIIGVN